MDSNSHKHKKSYYIIFFVIVLSIYYAIPTHDFYYSYRKLFKDKRSKFLKTRISKKANADTAKLYIQKLYGINDFDIIYYKIVDSVGDFALRKITQFEKPTFSVRLNNKGDVFEIVYQSHTILNWSPSQTDIENAFKLSQNAVIKLVGNKNLVYDSSRVIDDRVMTKFYYRKNNFRTHDYVYVTVNKGIITSFVNMTQHYDKFDEKGEKILLSREKAGREAKKIVHLIKKELLLGDRIFILQKIFMTKENLLTSYSTDMTFILCKKRKVKALLPFFLNWSYLPPDHLKNLWVVQFRSKNIDLYIWIDAHSGNFAGGRMPGIPANVVLEKY